MGRWTGMCASHAVRPELVDPKGGASQRFYFLSGNRGHSTARLQQELRTGFDKLSPNGLSDSDKRTLL